MRYARSNKINADSLELVIESLEVVAREFELSSPRDGWSGGELLWCSGLTADRFRTDTGDSKIEHWRSRREDSCWDINGGLDEESQEIALDFERWELLAFAHGLSLVESSDHAAVSALEPVQIGKDLEEAMAKIAELLSGQLGYFLSHS